jgi:(S)-3,5-dihydroxyphenylglycine transaminase
MTGVVGAAGSAAASRPAEREWLLRRTDLHGSVSDPILDSMNFLNEVTLRYPDAISFAPGRPYDGFFETDDIFAYIRRYLDHLAANGNTPGQIRDALFQYGPTAGQIRELIANSLRQDENIEVPPESIVVTVGCQEAMFLALRALISCPQDALLVSSPCYVGISGAARLLDIPVLAVEEAASGFRCADLDAAIRAEKARGRRPRVFYIVPDHSNPSGHTISLETRHELLRLAARHDILILEDSPYRLVSPGSQLPTLKCLDRERRVIYLGSFSKTAFPGARAGFVVADQMVADGTGRGRLLAGELAKIKSMITVNTSPLSQAAVAGMLLASGGRLSELNRETAAYYGSTMRATLQELDSHFGGDRGARLGVHWNKPSGGFFLALHVPFLADNAALARSAEEYGVIWTPMSHFYPGSGGERSIRLSTSYLHHSDIVTGISRLARFIEAEAQFAAPALPARTELSQVSSLSRKKVNRHVLHSAVDAEYATPVGVDLPMTVSTYATCHEPRTTSDLVGAAPRQIPRIAGIGTAVAGQAYAQQELLDIFNITQPKVRSIFLNSAIERRFLSLPPLGGDGVRVQENQGELLDKHKRLAVDMGGRALQACLRDTGVEVSDIAFLCCVTSTGFLTPGLSALLIRETGISPHCNRVDIVGMGCNAGLNALGVTAAWSAAHPGQVAVALCAEACSAAYVFDSTMRTAVVNSLFGDGSAAVAVISGPGGSAELPGGGPRILSFASHIITGALDAMRYDWDSEQGKFSFFLDPEIPYVVGAHAGIVVDRLLSRAGLRRRDIRHWLVHSGGKKVIDAVMINLGLARYELRHTTGVMRDYGNLSSGSFLFSYERLINDNVVSSGEYGVLMTMGPGSTIETALIQW